jgi:serine/threonine-protein kinase
LGIAAIGLLTVLAGWWAYSHPRPSNNPNSGANAPPGMVKIFGGEFMMGRNNGDDYEKPAHPVKVATFYLDQKEVTNEQYAAFVRATGQKAPLHWVDGNYPNGRATYPVVYVNWKEASDYCAWRGKRLPTEAEWEFAARGNDNWLYPYGNQWMPKYSSAAKSKNEPGELSAVGSYPVGASLFGVLDLAGNVAEWTDSDYKPYPNSPAKPDDGNKVVRGGSFRNPAQEQTATSRFFYNPTFSDDYIGFRCAQSAPAATPSITTSQ